MPALDLPVSLGFLAPPVRADDDRTREQVIGVNVVEVSVGIDEKADWLVRDLMDFR